MFLQCLPLKTRDAFLCEGNWYYSVNPELSLPTETHKDVDRSNAPISECVIPGAYHFQKDRRTKLKNFID